MYALILNEIEDFEYPRFTPKEYENKIIYMYMDLINWKFKDDDIKKFIQLQFKKTGLKNSKENAEALLCQLIAEARLDITNATEKNMHTAGYLGKAVIDALDDISDKYGILLDLSEIDAEEYLFLIENKKML